MNTITKKKEEVVWVGSFKILTPNGYNLFRVLLQQEEGFTRLEMD